MDRYLIDTNVILEIVLRQDKKEKCKQFLDSSIGTELIISDFTLHSIGYILLNRKLIPAYRSFVHDLLAQFSLVTLRRDLFTLFADTFNPKLLDYDDFYQYWVAVEEELTLVTLDNDFKKVCKDIPVLFL